VSRDRFSAAMSVIPASANPLGNRSWTVRQRRGAAPRLRRIGRDQRDGASSPLIVGVGAFCDARRRGELEERSMTRGAWSSSLYTSASPSASYWGLHPRKVRSVMTASPPSAIVRSRRRRSYGASKAIGHTSCNTIAPVMVVLPESPPLTGHFVGY
jgi:hypothetical protein